MKLLIIAYFSKQTQLIFWTYYIQSDCDYSREMWNEDNGKSDIPRNLTVSRIWSWQEIYKARNTENKPKQIHTAVSRNLIVSAKPPLTLRAILDTLWWSWVKKSFPTSIEMYVGGLIYQEQLVATSFQWAEALQRFCSRSQGVVALVSVSDGKIQITILILRRGALSTLAGNSDPQCWTGDKRIQCVGALRGFQGGRGIALQRLSCTQAQHSRFKQLCTSDFVPNKNFSF